MNFEELLKSWKWVQWLRLKGKQIVVPGFEGVSLYDSMNLFVRALFFGAISQRASSIAFSFFLALFPTILFFFTLIPYLPIENLNVKVLDLIHQTLPPSLYDLIYNLVTDITTRSHFGLLSFGFILAFIFATNGFKSIIAAFNTSVNISETRNFWQIQWISLTLLILVSFSTVFAIATLSFYEFFLSYFLDHGYLQDNWSYYLIVAGNWIIIISLVYVSFSYIFFFAPRSEGLKYRLFSAGSTFSTVLFIFSYLIFNYYVSNFARYNALYGSIGTLILLMLWIYFVAIILLVGFELNAAIKTGKIRTINKDYE